jgi:hypothetical protein
MKPREQIYARQAGRTEVCFPGAGKSSYAKVDWQRDWPVPTYYFSPARPTPVNFCRTRRAKPGLMWPTGGGS